VYLLTYLLTENKQNSNSYNVIKLKAIFIQYVINTSKFKKINDDDDTTTLLNFYH